MNAQLYQELLMDHYQHPRNHGRLDKPDFITADYNPSCGDSIGFEGSVQDSVIYNLKFTGKGCVISQAAASMLTELCIGKSLDYCSSLDADSIQVMLGLQLGPMRLKCALLSLHALKQGIINFLPQ